MRLVVKCGSSVLTQEKGGLDEEALKSLVSQLSQLHQAGHEVILVTSGAISAGVGRLGLKERPQDLRVKQAVASIGQLMLMKAYETAFSSYQILPAQILLTREDLEDRERYLNIRNTLLHLLKMRAIPIINENDSVSTDEIQFGDNDTLSAIVAVKVGADKLIILSDVPGLLELTSDGQLTNRVIPVVKKVTPELESRLSSRAGSKLSIGGMSSKVRAAKVAAAAGVETWIASGAQPHILMSILENKPHSGTCFLARGKRVHAKQAWIAFGRRPRGYVVIDEGAMKAMVEGHKSLLPSGVKRIVGTFRVGDSIGIRSVRDVEVGRGLTNYSSDELEKVKGRQTSDIPKILGKNSPAEVIHYDNCVLF